MIEYTLDNGEALNKESTETFFIPARAQRDNLLPGELVKLIFRMSLGENVQVERMWVIIKSRTDTGYIGTLDNDPSVQRRFERVQRWFLGPNMSFKYMNNRTRPNPSVKALAPVAGAAASRVPLVSDVRPQP